MQLKNYQEVAVEKLLVRSKELLQSKGSHNLVFKAPTGSGKTIMMAAFLERLVRSLDNSESNYSVIWTAPRKLHTQSAQKLGKFFSESQAMTCTDFQGLTNLAIGKNEILFLNWESINKSEKSTILKENERDFYLDRIIQNTKENGQRIILVIDESHHHATSEISKNLIADMTPDLTIEVSATPVITDAHEMVTVSLDQVKEQGMVKKSVILNPDFENTLTKDKIVSALASGTDKFVLDQGIEKLNALIQAYRSQGSSVRPLLLIQLPDRKSEIEDKLKEDVISHLEEQHGITVQNGKLAVYLSESKDNLENIARNDSFVEVMIFKQAIALGWDCPRAQILVLFRDHKSLAFSIQTVGRIMRMPEPEVGHYEDDSLNHAFIYTNLADISINEDVAKGYISIHTSLRREIYSPIELSSVYRLRQREKTRLAPLFTTLFLQAAESYELDKKIDLNQRTISRDLISSITSQGVDALSNETISGTLEIDVENEAELQKLFNYFIQDNLNPFYPEVRSVGRLKESIYKFFDRALFIDYANNFKQIIQVALSPKNRIHFVNVIDLAKSLYKTSVDNREDELSHLHIWEVPLKLTFTGESSVLKTDKSVMEPFYSDTKWKTEKAFIDFLDRSDQVIWWFKNGERDSTFFAVPYSDNGEVKPFYVDFIVQMRDGRVGLFDTKSGTTIDGAKTRSDGLQIFLGKNSRTWGGIVTNTEPRDFTGRWVYYTSDSAGLNSQDLSNWETLEL